MTVQRKVAESEAEDGEIRGSPESFPRHAVVDMVASDMDDVGARTICQGRTKTDLDGLHYRKVCRDNEAVECILLKELKLTAADMLRRKAVSDRMTQIDAEQQAAIVSRQIEVKYYERQAASRKTAVISEKSASNEKNRADKNGSGSGYNSLKVPERKCTRENVQSVSAV